MRRKLKWHVDDDMPHYGIYDPNTHTVHINLKRHKRYYPDKGTHDRELLDTFIHEMLHARFPKKTENEVLATTTACMLFLRPVDRVRQLKRFMAALS